ncbi:MAG: 30S ribosomal protein S9 [Candidatus Hatepunaea meridiana]|nr:30S ribosomal protein S9 [Candidatus Hatepunaea meridiana]
MKGESYYATGKRKTAVAKVWLRPGSGKIRVNKMDLMSYFCRDTLKMIIEQPLNIAGGTDKFDIDAKVSGGGKSAQADAMKLGMARALIQYNLELRPALKKNGFLTRDPREKERKKYGQPGARKRFQYSKR